MESFEDGEMKVLLYKVRYRCGAIPIDSKMWVVQEARFLMKRGAGRSAPSVRLKEEAVDH